MWGEIQSSKHLQQCFIDTYPTITRDITDCVCVDWVFSLGWGIRNSGGHIEHVL